MNNEYKANPSSKSNKVGSLYSIRKRNVNKLVVAHLNKIPLELNLIPLHRK